MKKEKIMTYLFLNIVNFHVPFPLKQLVILSLFWFNYLLTFHFHVDKLSFTLINFISLFSFSPIIKFFISYSAFKELFFLVYHNSFHAHCSLLYLKFILMHSLLMSLFHYSILHFHSFYVFQFSLFTNQFFFKFLLMTITSFE